MDDLTTAFFEGLARQGYEPLLSEMTGTLRFDLNEGYRTEHWLVDVKHGEVRVTNDNRPADCVTIVDHDLFAGMVAGRVNAMAALLRGEVLVVGSPALLVTFQRLFGVWDRTMA